MDFPVSKNIAETVAELTRDFGEIEHVRDFDLDTSSPHLVAVPMHRTIENLTGHHIAELERLAPLRRRGTAQLDDLASIILWGNRFKDGDSVLFANPDMAKPTLTCIADYHRHGEPQIVDGRDVSARHGAHRATYAFPLSDEWKDWMRVADKPLAKDEMGEFIESHAKDVMDPTPAILKGDLSVKMEAWEERLILTAQKIEGRFGQLHHLLAMSRQFQVFETSNLQVATNRDTGEATIQFVNEHKQADGKPLSIPNLIIVAIPVFRGGAAYRMPVRFRYRKSGADVKFILSPYNPEKAFEAAFDEACQTAARETGLPLFLGKPETATP